MVGKVISGSSFSGTVGYVMKEESRILEAKGIMSPEVKDVLLAFKGQTPMRPLFFRQRCNLKSYSVVF